MLNKENRHFLHESQSLMRENRQILSFLFVGTLEQILTELSVDPLQEPECLCVNYETQAWEAP